jgi:Txe/YoeB family toxin of toxin-antitoxin system
LEKYLLTFSKQAQKDAKLLAEDKLSGKAKEILEILEKNPMQDSPPYEKLRGELAGMYSRRINSKHRIVYELRDYNGPEYKGVVHIVRMRTHYKGMLSLFFL